MIDRTVVTEPKLNRIYIADIAMRGEDAFRTVQAAENRNGMVRSILGCSRGNPNVFFLSPGTI